MSKFSDLKNLYYEELHSLSLAIKNKGLSVLEYKKHLLINADIKIKSLHPHERAEKSTIIIQKVNNEVLKHEDRFLIWQIEELKKIESKYRSIFELFARYQAEQHQESTYEKVENHDFSPPEVPIENDSFTEELNLSFDGEVLSNIKEYISNWKTYSFNFGRELQNHVELKALTTFDRTVILSKIDSEIGSLRKKLTDSKTEIISQGILPSTFLSKEIREFSLLKGYHNEFLSELMTINSLGITDLGERLNRKKTAEIDYNLYRENTFSLICDTISVLFEELGKRNNEEDIEFLEVGDSEHY
ncbi:MAG: hypothetical protein AABZ74_08105 [Cyanobacteriota bacterium]